MSSTFPPGRYPGQGGPGNRLPPTMSDSPPPVYNGRYELNRQIARGGTAQVYLAHDLLLDRPVALKMLFPELSSDHSFVERFRREAQAAANLSHPNIVPVFDWGEADRTYYIVMEYVDGEPLSSIIRTQAPLAPTRAAAIAADIAKALSYAHRHGVVHRDVKPGNVLMTLDGQVKVGDFGIARAIGQSETVTQTGLVMGTATYFSPEQAQGLGVDGRSDVYALGVVLYEMVTGRPPFTADTPVAIAYKHVSETAVLPSEIEPRVPRDLEAIIMHAMSKQPQARYATAQDFHDDLERFMRDQPVLAAPPTVAVAAAPTAAVPANPTLVLTAAGLAAPTTTVQETVVAPVPAPGAPGAPNEFPKRRWVPWAVSLLVLLVGLAAIIYFGGRSLGWFGGTPSVHVADVSHMPYLRAESRLDGQGLHPQVKFIVGSAQNDHLVLAQSPAATTLVKKGSTVYLTVSSGPTRELMPYVIGQTQANATGNIRSQGFEVRYAHMPTTDPALLGTVAKQYPPSGSDYPQGTIVTLTIYKGTVSIPVPTKNVVGEPVAIASASLRANFVVVVGRYTYSSTVPKGDVIYTYPRGGSYAPEGGQVQLIVSEGPASYVPQVTGRQLAKAEQLITSAGLTYSITYTQNPAYVPGYVTNQSPSAGTQEGPGQVVYITVRQETTTTTTAPTTTTTSIPGASGASGPTGPSGGSGATTTIP